ncbi:MAG TPA: acyl-CoA dehydrogenase family protein [Acidimicrobiales bacterium]|nr:acyl-CoA dehydrogenase family protein [Acidimicrobiales bacterium]
MTTDATTTGLEAFRRELRSWLGAHLTDDVRAALAREGSDEAFEAHRAWNAVLFDAGYAAIGWPVEHGGRGAGLEEQIVLNEEMARAGAPGPVNAIGVANIAPAIMAFGTTEQQRRFLRPMLRGDEIWSQGMSEPGSGSDLASLSCRATRADGGDFVVDGQKTWNSNGDRADWCQLYVRTDPGAPKHRGITCLLVDMRTPGIEARPILTMAGDRGFAELFFTDARVPASALLGQVGEGWTVATTTLSNERAGVATLYLTVRSGFDRLLEAATTPGLDGARPADSPVARDRLMARYTEVRNLELLARRTLGAALGGRAPGPEGSVVKLAWSSASQAVARTAVDVLGVGALDGAWARTLLSSVSLSIAGGTTEVNKNIIGERVLGLPREPRPAAGGPRG